jgi:hypothetical protein
VGCRPRVRPGPRRVPDPRVPGRLTASLRHTVGVVALALGAGVGAAPSSAPSRVQFAALQAADMRVASIGYRLLTTNAALCRDLQPMIGASLQSLDQYGPSTRAAADDAFGFEAMIGIEGVVVGGPAARAGVTAGDSLVAVNGGALPSKPVGTAGAGTPSTRNAAEARIASLPSTAPVRLVLRRGGHDRVVVVQPAPGCRTGVELVLDEPWAADSNGERIRIGANYVDRFDNEEVAVVMAHELAHMVLRHRVRLDAAGVSRGMLSGIGRNGRLFRQTEDEADQLSVVLLYNAGYDPLSAYRFWIKPRVPDGGLFGSGTHHGAAARAALIRTAAASIPASAPTPYVPATLARRDEPLR